MYNNMANIATVEIKPTENRMKLDKQIAVRVTKEFRDKFLKKVRAYGRSSDVLRGLLEAFVENRIKITPRPGEKRL